mgnify:CR=1 FL=1
MWLIKQVLKKLLGLGPSLSPGKTLYKDISSLRPAHYLFYDGNDCIIDRYWGLQKKPHLKSYEETVQDVRYLVNQSIQRQLLSDVPIFLYVIRWFRFKYYYGLK